MVEFHMRLATRGRVHIPKVIVEQWRIWKDTLIHEKRLLQASALVRDQEVGFGPKVISWGSSCVMPG